MNKGLDTRRLEKEVERCFFVLRLIEKFHKRHFEQVFLIAERGLLNFSKARGDWAGFERLIEQEPFFILNESEIYKLYCVIPYCFSPKIIRQASIIFSQVLVDGLGIENRLLWEKKQRATAYV